MPDQSETSVWAADKDLSVEVQIQTLSKLKKTKQGPGLSSSSREMTTKPGRWSSRMIAPAALYQYGRIIPSEARWTSPGKLLNQNHFFLRNQTKHLQTEQSVR